MEITAQLTAHSLFEAYSQMTIEGQRIFRELLNHQAETDYKNAEWLPYSTDTLKELWDTPEEDYWDELYAKQHPTY